MIIYIRFPICFNINNSFNFNNFRKNLAFGYINNDYNHDELVGNDIYIEVEKKKYKAQILLKPLKTNNFKNI